MRGNPPLVLKTYEEFAELHGHRMDIGPTKGPLITPFILEHKPKVMVEFGGYMGYSAILFGMSMKQATPQSASSSLKYWSLEYNPLFASIAMNLIQLAGLNDVVTVVTGRADESIKRLKAEGQVDKIDMLFIDHWKDLYLPDFKTCEALDVFKKGTCIIGDNIIMPGAPDYRAYVRAHPGVHTKGLPVPRNGEVIVSGACGHMDVQR
jgi:catechol O-methyltransferase